LSDNGKMLFRLALVLLTCFGLYAAATEAPPGLRLPATVRPIKQSAELTLVPGSDTFHGRIDFDLDVREPRDIIWLNATDLKISAATVNAEPAEVTPGTKAVTGITPKQPIPAGAARLHIEYEGHISRDSSAGVFQLEEAGNWYVYTQFEPTDARRAFPCFDEPSFKSPWQISLRVPAGLMAVSNTPEISSTPEPNGMKLVRFAETRPLPSYLVAFATGPFEVVDAGRSAKRKVPLRIIVPKGHAGEAGFAKESIPQILALLEDYFGLPYPYEKLDSIVMPISNFAMENVGLITYGESLLLSKPEQDTLNRRRGCASVVAHEMAHQWFGDLVTTGWWDDIWLNEAFATWTADKMMEQWRPEWHANVDRVEERLYAMGLDSLVSARRIRQPIESEGDIANAFDGITYQKGAAVIRMFEQYVGPDRFRRGVQLYLKQHADKNATATDFLAAVSAGAGRDVSPVFSSFLYQPGVPLVAAELKCGDGKAVLMLSQKRSLPVGSAGSDKDRWMIPVCVKYEMNGSERSECTVLAQGSAEMALKGKSCPAWVLPNSGEDGYYRVAYRGDLLTRLLANGRDKLSTAEKVGVLGDIRASVRTGDMPAAAALKLVPQFASDPSSQVVSNAMGVVGLLPEDEIPAELVPKRADFIRSIFGARAEQLGWTPKPGESEDDQLMRQSLVPFVARGGQEKTLIDQAGKLAREWLETGKGVNPNMLGSVLGTAAQFGDRALFDSMLGAAKKAQDPRIRETLIGGLGSFRSPELARASMNLFLNKTFDIRESFGLLFEPMNSRETSQMPFEFVRANLDQILQILPREVGGDFAAGLVEVGNAFCSPEGAEEVDRYFKDKVKDWTGGDRRLANTLEQIRLCSARKAALLPSYSEGLSNYSGGSN
jgi:alanyl aminopeptidase